MEHTPGPWHWEIEDKSMATLSGKDFLKQHVMSVSPCGSCIDKLADDASPFGVCTMPTDANARLIAAAPELLAALEEIAEGKGQFSQDPFQHCKNAVEDMKELAQQAIAKAKVLA